MKINIKKTIPIVCILLIISICIISLYRNVDKLKKDINSLKDNINDLRKKHIDIDVDNIYNSNLTDFEKGANTLFDMDQYKKLSENDQVCIVGELLKKYESSNVISDIYYDDSTVRYTFKYKDTLAIIKIRDFDSLYN